MSNDREVDSHPQSETERYVLAQVVTTDSMQVLFPLAILYEDQMEASIVVPAQVVTDPKLK